MSDFIIQSFIAMPAWYAIERMADTNKKEKEDFLTEIGVLGVDGFFPYVRVVLDKNRKQVTVYQDMYSDTRIKSE